MTNRLLWEVFDLRPNPTQKQGYWVSLRRVNKQGKWLPRYKTVLLSVYKADIKCGHLEWFELVAQAK